MQLVNVNNNYSNARHVSYLISYRTPSLADISKSMCNKKRKENDYYINKQQKERKFALKLAKMCVDMLRL